MEAIVFETEEAIYTTIGDAPQPIDLDLYRKDPEAPRVGDLFLGRVIAQKAGYAFLDIGRTLPGLLRGRHPQGSLLMVQVRREEIQEAHQRKGVGLRLWTGELGGITQSHGVGLVQQASTSWLQALARHLGSLRCVYFNSYDCYHAARPVLDQAGVETMIKTDLDFGSELQSLWAALEDPVVHLPRGGYALIEEGVTLTAVDLNTAALSSYEHGVSLMKPGDVARYCREAAQSVLAELCRRGYGGVIVLDFPRVKDAAFRRDLEIAIKRLVPPHSEVFGFTRAGLFELTLPRRGASLPRKIHALRNKPWQN
ncbi:MAG: ribonuclease E/G [Holosporales bacterium]